MKRVALCAAGVLMLACLTAPAAHAGAKANVTVHNNSEFAIHNFFLSPSEQNHWGADQLGDDVIGKGAKFTLTDIPCNNYDVKLVDEDGDECVVSDVDICGGNGNWNITDDDLLDCEGYGDDEGDE
ncbi:MAG: hypothetical protein ABUT39_07860 [Acidobacteriota bacterium]